MYFSFTFNSTTTTGTNTGAFYFGQPRVVINHPLPPADPNRDWLQRSGLTVPQMADPRETQRVRTYLEVLGFSPMLPFDPHVARSTYRRLMREVHPDAGGDEVEAKRITNAWNELRRRGLVR